MLKRLVTAPLLATLVVICAIAGGKSEVPIVVQLTDSMRSQLPEKTVKADVRNVCFGAKANANFVIRLQETLDDIAESDCDNYLYTVTLRPVDNKRVCVQIISDDILADGGDAQSFYGVMSCGRRYFVFLRTDDNAELLRATLDKSGGKTRFVHEYEMVEQIMPRERCTLVADWDGLSLHTKTFWANGVNQLEQRIMPKQEDRESDGN